MCYQIYHICKYCGNQYECDAPNWICPTINFDENQLMCSLCEKKEQEDFKKAYENDEIDENKVISIKDWEFDKSNE